MARDWSTGKQRKLERGALIKRRSLAVSEGSLKKEGVNGDLKKKSGEDGRNMGRHHRGDLDEWGKERGDRGGAREEVYGAGEPMPLLHRQQKNPGDSLPKPFLQNRWDPMKPGKGESLGDVHQRGEQIKLRKGIEKGLKEKVALN